MHFNAAGPQNTTATYEQFETQSVRDTGVKTLILN